jgi:Mlc titration factor MtfA (ptsG expression regulator)
MTCWAARHGPVDDLHPLLRWKKVSDMALRATRTGPYTVEDAVAIGSLPQCVRLTASEHQDWLDLTRRLFRGLHWEPTNGFTLTPTIMTTVAAHIAYVLRSLGPLEQRAISTVVVHPTTMILTGQRPGPSPYVVTDAPQPVIGHTSADGPMFVAWDALHAQAGRPELGRNVVFHEVAHRLDVIDGTFDGTPPLRDRHLRRRWITICQLEYDALRAGAGSTLLGPYAAKNPAEFFAVATERFLTVGSELRHSRPELYDVFATYFRQHPAESTSSGAAPA